MSQSILIHFKDYGGFIGKKWSLHTPMELPGDASEAAVPLHETGCKSEALP